MAEAPKRAVKFSTNEFYKGILKLPDNELKHGVAGAMAGVTEAYVNCPFELVKIRMQAKDSPYKSTGEVALKVLKNEGVFALYKGVIPQAIRNLSWNSLYFGIAFAFKNRVFPQPSSKNEDLLYSFIGGSIGSAAGTTVATPFDVVKSRMQNVKPGDVNRWNSTFGTLRIIYGEEGGLRAIFKGLSARLYRLVPGGGIMLVAFDLISGLLG